MLNSYSINDDYTYTSTCKPPRFKKTCFVVLGEKKIPTLIKTYLRNYMGEERLSGFAIGNICPWT